MPDHALLFAGTRVLGIANAVGAAPCYHARLTRVHPEQAAESRRCLAADTLIVLIEGTLDIMINGAATGLMPGSHVFVPRGTWYGLRALGGKSATILTRQVAGPVPAPHPVHLSAGRWRVFAA